MSRALLSASQGLSPVVNIHAPTFVQGKAQVLTCDVKGFYPEAIAVNWLLNGVRTEAPRVNPSGTFNLESFYQFKPVAESEGAEISCEVQHETLSRPIVRSVQVHLEREWTGTESGGWCQAPVGWKGGRLLSWNQGEGH
uniref:Ig-like domain-containing protein n=1 Tax=Chelonoidis abingdonii TaxID=106734 RepID=A0A8C0GPE0_CHEAB